MQGLLAVFGGIGFMLGLGFTANEPKNQITRLGKSFYFKMK